MAAAKAFLGRQADTGGDEATGISTEGCSPIVTSFIAISRSASSGAGANYDAGIADANPESVPLFRIVMLRRSVCQVSCAVLARETRTGCSATINR